MMREQIGKRQIVRKLRAKQRQREYLIERDALAAIEREKEAMQQEAVAIDAAMQAAKAPPSVGETLTAADIDRRAQLAQQYASYLDIMDQRISEAETRHKAQKNKIVQALMIVRAADKAVDQLGTIDEKLAIEEARVAEIQEELQAETLAKPRWSK